MKRILILLMIAFTTCVVSAAPTARGLRLEYSLKPGTITKHRFTAEVEIGAPTRSSSYATGPSKMSLSALIRTTVLESLPDGTAKVSVSTEQMKVKTPGATSEMRVPDQAIVAIIDKHGKLIKYLEGKRPSAMELSSSTSDVGAFMLFPPRRLKVGETWTNKIALPGKDSHMEMKSKLVNTSTLLGKNRAAKIDHTFAGSFETTGEGAVPGHTISNGKAIVSGSGITYFSASKKKVLKTETNMEMTLKPTTGGLPTKTKMKAVLEAI